MVPAFDANKKMNTITESAKKITSVVLSDFIESGGELVTLETIYMGESSDSVVHVFEAEGRDGVYISDNGGTGWIDADFARVIEALRNQDTSTLPDAKAVSSI